MSFVVVVSEISHFCVKNVFSKKLFYMNPDDFETREQYLIRTGVKENNKETAPERYTARTINGMDVIDMAEHWKLNPQEMNILKYLLRDKGQDYDDMIKISDYALREAELIKKRADVKS